jgi:hypothetical protein
MRDLFTIKARELFFGAIRPRRVRHVRFDVGDRIQLNRKRIEKRASSFLQLEIGEWPIKIEPWPRKTFYRRSQLGTWRG